MLYAIDVNIDDPSLIDFFKQRDIDITVSSGSSRHGKLLCFKTTKATSIINAALSSLPSRRSFLETNRLLDIKERLTFHDCVIFTTLYFIEQLSTIENILTNRIESDNDIVNEILAVTNGYLVFNTQFEQLSQAILELPREKSIQFRRFYNKRRESIGDLTVDLNRLTEFMGILDRHMITECVLTPDFISGRNLFLCLKSLNR